MEKQRGTDELTQNDADPDKFSPLQQTPMNDLVGYNCRRAFAAIEPYFRKHMTPYSLRPGDFAVLSVLSANPNISPKRVAQEINVSPPNLAPLLDRLEQRGLLVRERNTQDKRYQTLTLTPEGKALCTDAEKTAVQLELEATRMLTDLEREQLVRLCQKIYLSES